VLQQLSEHIAKALERAAAAERRAADVTDPELRLDNERLAESWRFLARSFQFVESLQQFLTDARRQRNAFESLEEFLQRRNLPPPEPPTTPSNNNDFVSSILSRPLCPECTRPMWLTSIARADEPGFDKRTFDCPRCGEVESKIVGCNYDEEP
jgi:hypothetical protein